MESLMIKILLKLSSRTQNRDLLCALNIEPVEIKIKKLKINFVKRILENEFTKRIFKSVETQNNIFVSFVTLCPRKTRLVSAMRYAKLNKKKSLYINLLIQNQIFPAADLPN